MDGQLEVKKGFYEEGINYVKADLENMKKNYLMLGFHLKEIHDFGWYKYRYDADSFDKFCNEQFSLSKKSVYRLIQIVDKFCIPDSGDLKNEYKNYSQSQLIEMIPMSDDDMQYVRPDMTIKEIRQLKSYDSKSVPQESAIDKLRNLLDETKKTSMTDVVTTSRQDDLISDNCILAFFNNHFTKYPKDLAKKGIKDDLKNVLIETYGKSLQGGTLTGTDAFYDCTSSYIRFWFSNGHEDIKLTWSAFISQLFLLLPSGDLDQDHNNSDLNVMNDIYIVYRDDLKKALSNMAEKIIDDRDKGERYTSGYKKAISDISRTLNILTKKIEKGE